jgi:hypothetical protein
MNNEQGVTSDRFVRLKGESFNMMVVSADRMTKAAISAYIMGSKRNPMSFSGKFASPPDATKVLQNGDAQSGRIWHFPIAINDMMSRYMGKSFDRGGLSRKEREHGKRRAYQQAERDKEARQTVKRAKHMEVIAYASNRRQPVSSAPISPVETTRPLAHDITVRVIAQNKSGFLTQLLRRFFKKAA